MVEHAHRSKVAGNRRGTPLPQWEVFLRDERTEPLRHVGSVAASSADGAVEHAAALFDWHAADLWVCPAESVERYSSRPLSTETDSSKPSKSGCAPSKNDSSSKKEPEGDEPTTGSTVGNYS